MLDTTKAKTKLTPSTVKNLRSISAPSYSLTNFHHNHFVFHQLRFASVHHRPGFSHHRRLRGLLLSTRDQRQPRSERDRRRVRNRVRGLRGTILLRPEYSLTQQ